MHVISNSIGLLTSHYLWHEKSSSPATDTIVIIYSWKNAKSAKIQHAYLGRVTEKQFAITGVSLPLLTWATFAPLALPGSVDTVARQLHHRYQTLCDG